MSADILAPAAGLAALGLVVGVAIEGAVAAYRRDRSYWMWPPWRGRPGMPMAWTLILTAVTFGGLALQYVHEPLLLAVGVIEASLLLMLLFIDLDLRLIPTVPIGLLVLLALASAGAWPGLGVGRALLGGAVGFAGFGLLAVLGRRVFGEGALGMGDVYLALALGCMTGYPLVVGTLVLAVLLGGLGAGALLVLRRGVLGTTIPYGPFLCGAGLIVLIHGNTTHPFP